MPGWGGGGADKGDTSMDGEAEETTAATGVDTTAEDTAEDTPTGDGRTESACE